MRKLIAVWLVLFLLGGGVANAHQPVVLLDSDTTASKGPLLVDGTVSFAVRAAFSKAGLKKSFRAQFKSGDSLAVQYLIVDKRPENALKKSELPLLEISAPDGSKVRITFNERTKFFEPFGRTNYLYLGRYNAVAQTGIYSFIITSRSKAAITIAVGEKEIFGEVVRGALPTPTPTPTPTSS